MSRSTASRAASESLDTIRDAQKRFGKPVFVTDVALSSYPSSSYEKHQADALKKFFTGKAQLKQAGVHAILYRAWFDHPNKDPNNYYGQAERHWGLAWASNGTMKPAGHLWIDAVKDLRSGSAPSSTTTTSRAVTTTTTTSATTTTTAANRAPVASFTGSTTGVGDAKLFFGLSSWVESIRNTSVSTILRPSSTSNRPRTKMLMLSILACCATGVPVVCRPVTSPESDRAEPPVVRRH